TTIKNNSFTCNLLSSTFNNESDTTWDNNYWGRQRAFPKIILGMRYVGSLPVPWINIDKNPAKEPLPINFHLINLIQ
ncbi:MAG: hypothetical protein QCI00_05845, partial [Candidatus Thermoplasmatota archaeon]|nr:hypothetical protein [Candidatus Thermoplasmatota archaeon]